MENIKTISIESDRAKYYFDSIEDGKNYAPSLLNLTENSGKMENRGVLVNLLIKSKNYKQTFHSAQSGGKKPWRCRFCLRCINYQFNSYDTRQLQQQL